MKALSKTLFALAEIVFLPLLIVAVALVYYIYSVAYILMDVLSEEEALRASINFRKKIIKSLKKSVKKRTEELNKITAKQKEESV